MTTLHLEYESPSWWQCRGGCSGKICEEGQELEKAGPFFWRDPLGRCSCWWRGQSQESHWGAGAVETAPSSCGCALPAAFKNVLLQRLHFLSWFVTCSGSVHSLNSQIHIIRNFRQEEMSPFCIQLPFLWRTGKVLEQGQLSLPEQTTFLGLWSYPGTVYLVKGLAPVMHEQLRLHFLNGVHFVITEENTPVGS